MGILQLTENFYISYLQTLSYLSAAKSEAIHCYVQTTI